MEEFLDTMTEEELLKILLPGASSIAAMLTTVLVFLLTQYQTVSRSEELSKPYKRLAIPIAFAMIASAISAFISLIILIFGLLSNPNFYVLYYVALGSFLFALPILILGVLMVLKEVLWN
jgi:hypothetical protein